MDEKPFRVLLDFSEVNTGISELKYVWMHVSPREIKTIYDFKQTLIKKFSFNQENFKLFVRDGLLLETEKIAILREDDVVKVQFGGFSGSYVECSTTNSGINLSSGHVSCHSVGSSKSCKRKSETIVTASAEDENDCSSASRSKKKKKREKTTWEPDQTVNLSTAEKPLINTTPEKVSRLDESSKPGTSQRKNSEKPKKNAFHKIPTSEFIKFAMKLSEPERENQPSSETYVNAASSTNVKDNLTYTNLYNTAEVFSKTNLSPIPESTYELSYNQVTLNASETFSVNGSQIESATFVEETKGKSGRKKRRRKRKKVCSPPEDFGSNDNLEGTFVPSAEPYKTSSNPRQHIVYRSPTPPKMNMTVTVTSISESSGDESSIQNSVLKGDAELDSSQNSSLKENSELDVEQSAYNAMDDSTKESTPFHKKKSNGKSWGVTPLPRIGSTSHSFTMENSEISRTEEEVAKQAYQDCTPLNCLPPVGTRLAFKTLELNEEYCPEVTDYKEGIITKVDPNTDDLEIELIQEEIKPGRSGKFENIWNDEQPDSLVVKTVSLNWSALREPRIIPFANN